MAENLPSVDFKSISEMGNNLLNKIYSTGRWFLTRQTPKRAAVKSFIEDIEQRNDLNPIEKSALIANAKSIIKDYTNQINIVQLATDRLSEEAKPELVDEDWISSFLDHARLISNSDCQELWAKILCEECEEPGTISRHLLNIMASIGPREAQIFEALCKFAVNVDQRKIPIILDCLMEDYYPERGLSFSGLLGLQSLGLVTIEAGLFGSYATEIGSVVTYGEKTHQMSEEKNRVNVGTVLLTNPGDELSRIVETDTVDGYFEKVVIPFWEYGSTALDHRNDIRVGLGLEAKYDAYEQIKLAKIRTK